MKKLFGLITVLCLITVIFAAPVMAEDTVVNGTCGANGDNVTWSYDENSGILTISGEGAMKDFATDEIIPWSDHLLTVQKIVIENGVTRIGNYAFCSLPNESGEMAYKSVTSIDIADSVISIGDGAFYQCPKLSSVNLGNGVKIIGDSAFLDCQALTAIRIPMSVENIGSNAFFNCNALGSIELGENLSTIGERAFFYCSQLSSIVIPKNVSEIGDYAFYGCSSLLAVCFEGDAPNMNFANVFYTVPDDIIINYYEGTAGWSDISDSRLKSIPAPLSQSEYTASLSSSAAVAVNEQILVTVTAGKEFSAAALTLTYDTTVFTFNEDASTLNGAAFADTNGTLTLTDFGEEQSSYILAFTAKAAAKTEIKLTSAAFSTAEDAATEDLTPATIENGTVSVTVNPTVALPSDGSITGSGTAVYGEPYTFSIADYVEHNTYDVTATMGGESVTVTDNGTGSYSIANVTDTLEIFVTVTPKTYDIDFQTETDAALPEDTDAAYGTDFEFPIPSQPYYTTSITKIYYQNSNNEVPHTVSDGKVRIAGANITDNIVIVIDRARAEVSVSVEGNAASDAAGYNSMAEIGSAYTLTVTQDSKYIYTVTASVDGQSVELSASGNTYTVSADQIKADSKSVIFTVTKTLKTEHVTVSAYLTLNDGMKLWLIQVPGSKADDTVYCYDNTPMLWSDTYEAYCTVVASTDAPTVNAENLTLAAGTAAVVNYGGDVNKSGSLDVNDAQFVYNMYTTAYSGITETVTAEKYLRADVNGDKTIDTEDAAAIVNQILYPNGTNS